MIDPYASGLAFILGLLAGWSSQSWYAKRLWWRLKGTMPRRCPICTRWYGSRANMHFVEHRAAGWIYICQDCYDEQYRPFSKENPQ